jgi:hypothetical protein
VNKQHDFEYRFASFLNSASLPMIQTCLELIGAEILSRGLVAREALSGAVAGLAVLVVPSLTERQGSPRRPL